jgi:hypothetical protein
MQTHLGLFNVVSMRANDHTHMLSLHAEVYTAAKVLLLLRLLELAIEALFLQCKVRHPR